MCMLAQNKRRRIVFPLLLNTSLLQLAKEFVVVEINQQPAVHYEWAGEIIEHGYWSADVS